MPTNKKGYMKKYFDDNYEKYKTIYRIPTDCEICGCTVNKDKMKRHTRSQKHIKNVKKLAEKAENTKSYNLMDENQHIFLI